MCLPRCPSPDILTDTRRTTAVSPHTARSRMTAEFAPIRAARSWPMNTLSGFCRAGFDPHQNWRLSLGRVTGLNSKMRPRRAPPSRDFCDRSFSAFRDDLLSGGVRPFRCDRRGDRSLPFSGIEGGANRVILASSKISWALPPPKKLALPHRPGQAHMPANHDTRRSSSLCRRGPSSKCRLTSGSSHPLR
jgi:hypothetical protein